MQTAGAAEPGLHGQSKDRTAACLPLLPPASSARLCGKNRDITWFISLLVARWPIKIFNCRSRERRLLFLKTATNGCTYVSRPTLKRVIGLNRQTDQTVRCGRCESRRSILCAIISSLCIFLNQDKRRDAFCVVVKQTLKCMSSMVWELCSRWMFVFFWRQATEKATYSRCRCVVRLESKAHYAVVRECTGSIDL